MSSDEFFGTYSNPLDDSNEEETQLSNSVMPEFITDFMSVENVTNYLKENGIPQHYCDVFRGITGVWHSRVWGSLAGAALLTWWTPNTTW
jgi:hypothetical protein